MTEAVSASQCFTILLEALFSCSRFLSMLFLCEPIKIFVLYYCETSFQWFVQMTWSEF